MRPTAGCAHPPTLAPAGARRGIRGRQAIRGEGKLVDCPKQHLVPQQDGARLEPERDPFFMLQFHTLNVHLLGEMLRVYRVLLTNR